MPKYLLIGASGDLSGFENRPETPMMHDRRPSR